MRLVWVVIPLVLFGIGFFSPTVNANVCFGLGYFMDQEESIVFSGNVKSIEMEMYDEPIYYTGSFDFPDTYGIQHIFFEVHQMFDGPTFETIEYRVSINNNGHDWDGEIDKEYLVIGYMYDEKIGGNDNCSGTGIIEISNSIKNSDMYIKPVNFVELLTTIHNENYLSTPSSRSVEELSDSIKQRAQSPTVQLQNSISPKEILCKEDLQLFFKNNYDSSPVCIKTSSVQKLIERGWGNEKFIDNHPNNIIQINDSKNYLKYRITDDSTITEVIYNEKHRSLILTIDTMVQGKLVIELPRHVIDAKKSHGGDDSEFIILIKGNQMEYNEISSTVDTRTLIIPFEHEITQIEIIGVTVL